MAERASTRRGPAGLSLARMVAKELRAQAARGFFMYEVYGADGEIEESRACHPLTEEDSAPGRVQAIVLRRPDAHGHYAEPKTDWRARGVIPPRGFHRCAERQAG